jgi:ABC-type glycerol-3-phosphate transport system permease component
MFPFYISFDVVIITGACLWSLALYLALVSLREKIIDGLERWFNFAERFLYTSEKEFERTRKGRESQNAFLASLMSIVPFFVLGILCNWLVGFGFGKSWEISMGILACISCGVYALGRYSQE